MYLSLWWVCSRIISGLPSELTYLVQFWPCTFTSILRSSTILQHSNPATDSSRIIRVGENFWTTVGYILIVETFISLLFSTAFAQAPTPEEYLMMYAPNPVMIEISRCESGWNQFSDDGSVLTSHTSDLGLFQINKSWKPTAKKLRFDITTIQGNIGFALWLYQQYGTSPWTASKSCWGTASP